MTCMANQKKAEYSFCNNYLYHTMVNLLVQDQMLINDLIKTSFAMRIETLSIG